MESFRLSTFNAPRCDGFLSEIGTPHWCFVYFEGIMGHGLGALGIC